MPSGPPERPALPDLPVVEAIPAVRAALAEHRRAVLVAPPGAGKTTVIPLALLDEAWLAGQRIVMLEPRRLATRAAARRMAETTRTAVGALVGYQTRDERHIGAATRIEVVTEGVLTRRLQNDPELPGVGLVIFDEVHERNLTTDLGLALALDVASTIRPDLRLLAMSATPDVEGLTTLLDAPVIESEGRMFDVEMHWTPRSPTGGGATPAVDGVGDRPGPGPGVATGSSPTSSPPSSGRCASRPATSSCSCPGSARSDAPSRCCATPSDRTSTCSRSPARSRSPSRTQRWRRRGPGVAGSCCPPTSPRPR